MRACDCAASQRSIEESAERAIEKSYRRTVEPSNHRTVEPSNRRTVEPSNHRTIEPSNRRTIEPSNHRTIEPSNHRIRAREDTDRERARARDGVAGRYESCEKNIYVARFSRASGASARPKGRAGDRAARRRERARQLRLFRPFAFAPLVPSPSIVLPPSLQDKSRGKNSIYVILFL